MKHAARAVLLLAMSTGCFIKPDPQREPDGGSNGPRDDSGLGSGYNLAFVSTTTFAVPFSVAEADAACAHDSGEPAIAWLADLQHPHPAQRLGNARGWKRMDGAPIADVTSDFTEGRLLNTISFDTMGATSADIGPIATNTQASGSWPYVEDPCSTGADHDMILGDTMSTTVGWTEYLPAACDKTARYHVYCLGTGHATPLEDRTATTDPIAFVTPATYKAGSLSIDAFCQSFSPNGHTFRALVARTGNRVTQNVMHPTFMRPDHVVVTTDGFKTLLAPVNVTPMQTYVDSRVWLGVSSTAELGTVMSTCGDWTNNTIPMGVTFVASDQGASTSVSTTVRSRNDTCDQAQAVICIQAD